jgi:hypothetical protein
MSAVAGVKVLLGAAYESMTASGRVPTGASASKSMSFAREKRATADVIWSCNERLGKICPARTLSDASARSIAIRSSRSSE